MAYSLAYHDFQAEVNKFLALRNVPFRCVVSVKPDGNCFFRAICWQMDKDDVRITLATRARKINHHLALRRAAVRFMEWDEVLPTLDTFQEYKMAIDEGEGWLKYLHRIKEYGEWADDCIIWCTALFLGKDILSAGDTNDERTPWTIYPGHRPGTTFRSSLPPLTVAYLSQRHYEPIERQMKNQENECMGCASTGKSIVAHLCHKTNTKLCKTFYDIEEEKKTSKKESKEKYKRKNPEAVKESLKRSHKKH